MKKLWEGRFSKGTAPIVESFTESISFDWKLYQVDIQQSLAHADMLKQSGLLSEDELSKIRQGLHQIQEEIKSNQLTLSPHLEDIHMAIESRLIEIIGDTGKKLHTARSRNDQVATDTRLYLKGKIILLQDLLKTFIQTLVELAEQHTDTIMPGYTHLVKAQPTTLAHHLLAYCHMFVRDLARLKDCYKRLRESLPLGAGALASSTLPIQPAQTAKLLDFDHESFNSLDSVADRDYIIEFTSCASIIMMHFSRLSEELIIWNTEEFGFIEFDDAYATGSSMMPQKKNPDIPELIRGKTARVYGNLMQILTLMKGLPLTYNRDFQEDKEPLFNTLETLEKSLTVVNELFHNITFHKENLYTSAYNSYINATDAMEYLIKKGIPNREAHSVTGKLIAYCLAHCKYIHALTLEELKSFSEHFCEDFFDAIKLENCITNRNSLSGPAKQSTQSSIAFIKTYLT